MTKLTAFFKEDGPVEDVVFIGGCLSILGFCGYIIVKAIQTFM